MFGLQEIIAMNERATKKEMEELIADYEEACGNIERREKRKEREETHENV